MDVGRQKLRKNCDFEVSRATITHGRWTSKTEEKLRLWGVPRNLYARNGRWTSKTVEKLPLRTKWTLDVKNWGKIATFIRRAQPFRTKWTLDVKNWGKIATLLSQSQPWHKKWTLDVKNWAKNAMDVVCVHERPSGNGPPFLGPFATSLDAWAHARFHIVLHSVFKWGSKRWCQPIMGLGVERYSAAAPTSLDMTAVNNKQNFGAQTCRIKYLGM